MGKLKDLDLKLKKVPLYPGQLVEGDLLFRAQDAVSIKNIVLFFKGTSKSGWSGDGSGGGGSEHTYYRAEIPTRKYLTEHSQLRKNGAKGRLTPGNHRIPFAFPLPNSVPATFGGKFGYVYHCCRAVITTAGNSEIRVERAVPVVGLEDLNLHPYAAMPFSAHEGYTQRLLCLKMADLSVVLQIPRTGYCPGEVVKISGEIINRSLKQKIRKSAIQLIQSVQYSAGAKKKMEVTVVAERSWGEVVPDDVMTLEDEPLTIPALPPSFLRGCDHIAIAYELLFTVEPGIRIGIPLIIGTVPYTRESLRKFVRALPWKTGPEIMSKKQLEAQASPHIFFPPPPPPQLFGPRLRPGMPPSYPGGPPPMFRPCGRPRPRPGHPQFVGPIPPRGPLLHPRFPGPNMFQVFPQQRKPSSQPYVTEVSDNDSESIVSKRHEKDTARPHGVLKIEEIE